MPTSRPRYQITETSEVERALDEAARRWPGESRSRLLVRLVRVGADALHADEQRTNALILERLDSLAGAGSGMFGDDYLADLREEWPT